MDLINILILALLLIIIIINIFVCYKIFNTDEKTINLPVKKTIRDIFKNLPNNLMLIYYIEGCGWCNKYQEMLKEIKKDKNDKKNIIEVYFKPDGTPTYTGPIDKYNKDLLDKMVKESLEIVDTFPTTITKDKHKVGCFDKIEDLKEFINT